MNDTLKRTLVQVVRTSSRGESECEEGFILPKCMVEDLPRNPRFDKTRGWDHTLTVWPVQETKVVKTWLDSVTATLSHIVAVDPKEFMPVNGLRHCIG